MGVRGSGDGGMRAGWPDGLPPSMIAARRQGAPGAGRRERAYPEDAGYDDRDAVQARLNATRALLGATTPEQVAAIAATLVHDLGGGLVPARLADEGALPVDLAFGTAEPLLARADPLGVASMRLAAVLPPFVEDARAAVHRLEAGTRRAQEAETDQLTGLLTRREWMRRLARAGPCDSVALVDLDLFKQVNDRAGHLVGDTVLRAVAALLARHFRGEDSCGRYGGDELAVLAVGMPAEALAARLDEARTAWRATRPPQGAGVGLSAGVAALGGAAPRVALAAADRALYRAKDQGRDRTATASRADLSAASGGPGDEA